MPRNAEVAWNATYSVKAKKMRSTIFSEGTSRMCNFVTKDKLSNGTPQVSGGHLGGPDCAFYVYLNCVFMLTWGQSGPGLLCPGLRLKSLRWATPVKSLRRPGSHNRPGQQTYPRSKLQRVYIICKTVTPWLHSGPTVPSAACLYFLHPAQRGFAQAVARGRADRRVCHAQRLGKRIPLDAADGDDAASGTRCRRDSRDRAAGAYSGMAHDSGVCRNCARSFPHPPPRDVCGRGHRLAHITAL